MCARQTALLASEQESLESAMLEDKLRATDWETTEEAIQEQVARESYLQWMRDRGHSDEQQVAPQSATTAAACASTTAFGGGGGGDAMCSSSAGRSDESESQLLARVLRQSQQE